MKSFYSPNLSCIIMTLQTCILLTHFIGFCLKQILSFFLFSGPSRYARKVQNSTNQRQIPKLEFKILSCIILTSTTLFFVAPLFFASASNKFRVFFCFEDLPDMLGRCITAQIKDKDLNLNLETSPA